MAWCLDSGSRPQIEHVASGIKWCFSLFVCTARPFRANFHVKTFIFCGTGEVQIASKFLLSAVMLVMQSLLFISAASLYALLTENKPFFFKMPSKDIITLNFWNLEFLRLHAERIFAL
jgi:hypothetical protein